jgi:hypothetical protein
MDDSVTLVQKEMLRVLFDCICGLVVTVPGYTTEMNCAPCEVRTEFMYVMYELNLYTSMLCRRK